MTAIDLATTPTQAFEPTEVHRALHALAGHYQGTTQTWFEPKGPPVANPIDAHAEVILGGRFVRLTYTSTIMNGPHAGELLLGWSTPEAQLSVAWIDSFHTSPAMMISVGIIPAAGKFSVLGSYAAGAERWGWATVISQPNKDSILIEMFNISPTGVEDLGVEMRLERVSV
jgi:hypothetical protein